MINPLSDPFRERDPRWQPNPNSVEAALLPNFRDFIREAQAAAMQQQRPRPNLPPGMYLQQLANGTFGLLYPSGSSGYRMIEGDYDELIELASQWTTE